MTEHSLKDLAKKMAGINIASFSTQGTYGWMASRPMSNNGEVEYDGTSYYFAFADSNVVHDIKRDDKVALSFENGKGLYVTVKGKATLTEDKSKMADHWTPALDAWFKDGLDTDGVVMVKVDARHIRYWDTSGDKMDMGEIDLK